MNINQAKAVAGIQHNVTDRNELERALERCISEIIAARKANNDIRAAELSEAKEVFRRRLRSVNTCGVCGKTISRGATHCRIHRFGAKPKALPVLPGWQPESKPQLKGNSNGRIAMFPRGGLPAMLGYYSRPVKKVVAKWCDEIPEEILKRYLELVAFPLFYQRNVQINETRPRHLQAIYELGVAITTLYNNNASPESWLLKQPGIFIGSPCQPWAEVIAYIKKSAGPTFTENILKQTAKRMMLLTPRPVAATIRREFDRLCRGPAQVSTLLDVVSEYTLR
ncbi:MAG TPA: hypothetical protein VNU95_10545 [Candidatus Acidoferrales bacterium]|jgi:hypothetical protein|nr:hypothetical protein [Candidatus Acidoferrales bacterium]